MSITIDPDQRAAIDERLQRRSRRYVPKYTILKRLQDAGLLAQAFAAFDQLSREKRELWHAAQDIWSEDPDTLALLRAIGADPDEIMAVS